MSAARSFRSRSGRPLRGSTGAELLSTPSPSDPRTRALATRIGSGAACARNASISARNLARARLDDRQRLLMAAQRRLRTRFASARPRLASTAPRPRPKTRRFVLSRESRHRRDASNGYRAIHFSKTRTRHFARLPATDRRAGECCVSRRLHSLRPDLPNCRRGVFFRPTIGEPNLWPPSPSRSRTNLRGERARQLLDQERFHRCFAEKSRLPRSEDLPSPGGPGRLRCRDGMQARAPMLSPSLRSPAASPRAASPTRSPAAATEGGAPNR
jgi:hypothetical protein